MIARVERQIAPLRRAPLVRRRKGTLAREADGDPKRALAYSNGSVMVEISHEALEAYVEVTGDVPLPVVDDAETGDRVIYDPVNDVRVVYDAASRIREVSTRTNDGLFVRINFIDDAECS